MAGDQEDLRLPRHVLVEMGRVDDARVEPRVHERRLDLAHAVRGLDRVAVLVDGHLREEKSLVDPFGEDVRRGSGPKA
ncbi:MAG: hypothetical protein ACHQ0I_04580 [Candidatus Lutacidiplasmatales archaeon]